MLTGLTLPRDLQVNADLAHLCPWQQSPTSALYAKPSSIRLALLSVFHILRRHVLPLSVVNITLVGGFQSPHVTAGESGDLNWFAGQSECGRAHDVHDMNSVGHFHSNSPRSDHISPHGVNTNSVCVCVCVCVYVCV